MVLTAVKINPWTIHRVTPELAVTGQIRADHLLAIAQNGYRSILNLRSPREFNALADEPYQVALAGLIYANAPLNQLMINSDQIMRIIWELDDLPKPIVIHSGLGARAGAIALIAATLQADWTLADLKTRAAQIGLDWQQPHLQQFIREYYDTVDLSVDSASVIGSRTVKQLPTPG